MNERQRAVMQAALEALAEPQQEPVAVIHVDGSFVHVEWRIKAPDVAQMPVFCSPPRREWRWLTDEQRLDAFGAYLEQTSEERARFRTALSYSEEERESFDAGWAAAEAALREKNGGDK